VLDMTEQSDRPGSINAQPTANGDASAAHDAKSAQTPPEPRHVPREARKATRKRKLLAGVLGAAVLAVLLVFGIPWVEEALDTVSTDDAFVNGHVTFVAPRVAGQVSRVLADDNNRVHKGDRFFQLSRQT
jgi:membrane fusion protein (multidrug efflux system)